MAEHTPGPWNAFWSKYDDREFIVQTEHPSNRVIATFDDDGDGAGEQSIADAHLISAAPDMLKTLRRVLNHPLIRIPGDVEITILATIAKAVGRA